MLSNKYAAASRPGADPMLAAPPGARLRLFPGYMERYLASEGPAAVALYSELASSFRMSPSAFAVAFCESRRFVSSTIVGATETSHLLDAFDGFGVEWTDAMEEGVQEVLQKYPDPWRMLVRDGG